MLITFFLFNCVLGRRRPAGRESGACPPGGEFIVLMSDVSILLCSKYHTHTRLTTRVNRYQKGKTNLDFTEARDSEWQWHQPGYMQVCTSLQTDNHASAPPLVFLQAGCPSCRPTNSVKARVCIAITWCKCGILLCSNTCHTFCGPYVSVYWSPMMCVQLLSRSCYRLEGAVSWVQGTMC